MRVPVHRSLFVAHADPLDCNDDRTGPVRWIRLAPNLRTHHPFVAEIAHEMV